VLKQARKHYLLVTAIRHEFKKQTLQRKDYKKTNFYYIKTEDMQK